LANVKNEALPIASNCLIAFAFTNYKLSKSYPQVFVENNLNFFDVQFNSNFQVMPDEVGLLKWEVLLS
jgi:hypothetical protein